jgi:glycosyltransferase involved in cell wall biosynthesis
MTKIAITAPVRNRAWALPDYLAALETAAQGFDAVYSFINDGSTDGSGDIIAAWLETHPGSLVQIEPDGERNTSSRDARNRQACYRRLATMRNDLIDTALASGADWQFSVDSDILVAPWCIRRLIGHGRPYCSSIIDNTRTISAEIATGHVWPKSWYNAMVEDNGCWSPMRQPIRDRLLIADLTGACYVASRPLLASGARFSAHPIGEDAGYALSLASHGHVMATDTGCHAVHCFASADLDLARQSLAALTHHGAR